MLHCQDLTNVIYTQQLQHRQHGQRQLWIKTCKARKLVCRTENFRYQTSSTLRTWLGCSQPVRNGILRQVVLPSSTSRWRWWKLDCVRSCLKDKPNLSSCLSQRLQNQPKVLYVNFTKEVAQNISILVQPVRRLLHRTRSHILLRNSMWHGPHSKIWCTFWVRQPVLPVHVHDRCCLLCQSTPCLCFSVDKVQQSFCQPWQQPPALLVTSQRLDVGPIWLSRSQLIKQAELYDITVLLTKACLYVDLAMCIQAQHTPLWVRSRSSYYNLAG